MPMIEYMLHKTRDGRIVPEFVEKHLGFEQNETYLGYVKPATTRGYYLPDTVKEYTKEQFITRILEERKTWWVDLTEDQVKEKIGEEYDSILARFEE
jgi:hypothetical protein